MVCSSFALVAFAAADAVAQDTASEYPTAVSAFEKVCLVPGTNPDDRKAAISADPDWEWDPFVSVDVPSMGMSRAIDRNYSFSKPAQVRQWSGMLDGHKVRWVLATFDGKVRYPNLCALVLDGPANAMMYADELKAAFAKFGIKGKSVDLVHYFEFAGKVGTDQHPVRGEIFSRSLSGRAKNTTHIYVAY